MDDYDLDAYLNSMNDSTYRAIEEDKKANEERFSNARQANRLDDGIKKIEEEFLTFLPLIKAQEEVKKAENEIPLANADERANAVASAKEEVMFAKRNETEIKKQLENKYKTFETSIFSGIDINASNKYETIEEVVEDIPNNPRNKQKTCMPCSNLVKIIRQKERPIMPCENLVNSIKKHNIAPSMGYVSYNSNSSAPHTGLKSNAPDCAQLLCADGWVVNDRGGGGDCLVYCLDYIIARWQDRTIRGAFAEYEAATSSPDSAKQRANQIRNAIADKLREDSIRENSIICSSVSNEDLRLASQAKFDELKRSVTELLGNESDSLELRPVNPVYATKRCEMFIDAIREPGVYLNEQAINGFKQLHQDIPILIYKCTKNDYGEFEIQRTLYNGAPDEFPYGMLNTDIRGYQHYQIIERSVNCPPPAPALEPESQPAPAPMGTGSKLWNAASAGDVAQVQELCEMWSGHDEVINWAHPNFNDETPLHAAHASPRCATILLKTLGINVNKGDAYGKTPLWKAAFWCKLQTVEVLLTAPGIDLNKAPTGGDYKGKSPLTIARERVAEGFGGCNEVVRLLEGAAAAAEANSAPALTPSPAPASGLNPLANEFVPGSSTAALEAEVNSSDPETEAAGRELYEAASDGNYPEVRSLSRKWKENPSVLNWANPDDNGKTPLHAAFGHDTCMSTLTNTPGIDVNKWDNDGITPLWMAAHECRPDIIKILLAAPGIDINKAPTGGEYNGMSPLYIANTRDNSPECREVVKLLSLKRSMEQSNTDAKRPRNFGGGKSRKNKQISVKAFKQRTLKHQ